MKKLLIIVTLLYVCGLQAQSNLSDHSYVNFEKIMNELFASADAKLSEEERAEISAVGSSPVYGEIIFESMAYLLQELAPTNQDVFYDLGCGLGRFVVQAFLMSDVCKSVGIELSKTRFEQAYNVLDKTRAIYKNCFSFDNSLNTILNKQTKKKIKNKTINFLNEDILEVDFSDATILYIALTLNSDEFKNKLNEKIVQLDDGLRVLSLHLLEHQHLHLIKTYYLPMTWSANTPVYFYILDKEKKLEREEDVAPFGKIEEVEE